MMHVIKPEDICLFCLDELRRGIPENGVCGHEELNAKLAEQRDAAPSVPEEKK